LIAEVDDLFQAALGLAEPWQVTRTEFDVTTRRLDLYLDFPDFFQHQAYLHARVPRVTCPAHGTRLVALPWARPGSGFTLLFEALLMAMLGEMPVKAVAELVGEHDTRLWRLLHHHVERARAKVSMAEVTRGGRRDLSPPRPGLREPVRRPGRP
jgi:transposase